MRRDASPPGAASRPLEARPTGRRVASQARPVRVRGAVASRPACRGPGPPRRPLYRTEPRRSFPRNMAIFGVIPARFASTRLPGKPLLSDTGKPMIRHVVEAARTATRLDRIVVATDDERIADAVRGFGGEVVMTRSDHPTGTDRVAEVIAAIPEAHLIVNIQGDEPELSGASLDLAVSLLEADPSAPMATLATPIRDEAVYRDPSCVKVVRSNRGRALYFSRSPIPFHRDGPPDLAADPPAALLHLGLYAYRRDFLLGYAKLPPSPLRVGREARAAPSPRSRPPDRPGDRPGAERRHRHAGGLPDVRRTLASRPGRRSLRAVQATSDGGSSRRPSRGRARR